jgi:predicted MFS family arabinose efflux permease
VSGRRAAYWVLGLLAVANLLNYGARNVLFPVYEDLRAAFAFSNTELGLLGTAFMITHALATIPFGWAGDRFDRRRVIAAGIIVWSVAGLAGAAADSFGEMMIARALVGIGTAACVPVANALLCELFPAERKARMVSIFNLGLFLGGGAGFGFGGVLGWPLSFIVLALPGVLLAALVVAMPVPARRGAAVAAGPGSLRELMVHARELLRVRTLRWLMVATTIMAFAAGGYTAWFFELLTKTKGLGEGGATTVLGVAFVAGLLGVIAGGVIADRLRRQRAHGRLIAMTIGMLATVPFALLSIFVDGGWLLYVASFATMFFITWYHAPMAASVDDLAADDRATTAQALVIFTMHLLGTAPSSFVVGLVVDAAGLRVAMLVPTVALAAAGLVMIGGWKSFAADAAAAGRATGGGSAAPAI